MSYSSIMAHAGFIASGTTPGTTATTSGDDDGGGSAAGAVIQIGILLMIPVGMYFLMIRPQRRRMRAQSTMQTSLEVGDEIVTTAGIFGFITGFDGDQIWLEIDDDVQVRIARAAVQGKVDTAAAPSEAPSSTNSTNSTSERTDDDTT